MYRTTRTEFKGETRPKKTWHHYELSLDEKHIQDYVVEDRIPLETAQHKMLDKLLRELWPTYNEIRISQEARNVSNN